MDPGRPGKRVTAVRPFPHQLQAMLDAISLHVAVLDEHGRILLVNAAWRQGDPDRAHRHAGAGIGLPYLDVCAASFGPALPAVAAGLSGLDDAGTEFQAEFRCCRSPDLRWFMLRARRFDADGQRCVMISHDDVTARHQAVLEAAESRARLRLALDSGRMGTWDLDLKTGIETWNDFHYLLFGVDPATFVPSTEAFEAMVDPRDLPRLNRVVEDVLADIIGPEYDIDFRIILPDGRTRWIGGGGRLVRDEDGRPDSLLGVSFDITERKNRELAIEAANRAKSDFLAAMSHEIRTPMTGVLGMADLLAGEALTPAQHHYVDTIRRSGSHLLSVINSILDFSRIEAGRLELESIDFAPVEVLDQVCSILRPQAVERGLELRLEVPADLHLAVQGDPTKVRQVLVNLVGNALKFTSKGKVSLALQAEPDGPEHCRLRFEVADDGIGIPPDRQATIFEPFVQVDRSTTRHFGGSGLGLAICKRLVDAMGGSIGVANRESRGSRFWVELRLPIGHLEALEDHSGPAPAVSRHLYVLVVDDVSVNRDLLTEMLHRHGHQVVTACDGADAVMRVAQEPFDVVLMDVQMPVMDGVEATRQIRALPRPTCDVPILALTANVMPAERAHYLASGMNACLTKPIVWQELFAALAKLGAAPPPDLSPPASEPPTDVEPPLLDPARLDPMIEKMPGPFFAQMLTRGIENAARSSRLLSELAGQPDVPAERIKAEAHRLRGTAGTLGLARISAIAAVIEDHAADSSPLALLVGELDAAVGETQEALRLLLVGRPPATPTAAASLRT